MFLSPGSLTSEDSYVKQSNCLVSFDPTTDQFLRRNHTLDFLLSTKRDGKAAARFFRKVLKAEAHSDSTSNHRR